MDEAEKLFRRASARSFVRRLILELSYRNIRSPPLEVEYLEIKILQARSLHVKKVYVKIW